MKSWKGHRGHWECVTSEVAGQMFRVCIHLKSWSNRYFGFVFTLGFAFVITCCSNIKYFGFVFTLGLIFRRGLSSLAAGSNKYFGFVFTFSSGQTCTCFWFIFTFSSGQSDTCFGFVFTFRCFGLISTISNYVNVLFQSIQHSC